MPPQIRFKSKLMSQKSPRSSFLQRAEADASILCDKQKMLAHYLQACFQIPQFGLQSAQQLLTCVVRRMRVGSLPSRRPCTKARQFRPIDSPLKDPRKPYV